jgi:hypothetical protein
MVATLMPVNGKLDFDWLNCENWEYAFWAGLAAKAGAATANMTTQITPRKIAVLSFIKTPRGLVLRKWVAQRGEAYQPTPTESIGEIPVVTIY